MAEMKNEDFRLVYGFLNSDSVAFDNWWRNINNKGRGFA
jgi:hypothetical protein